MQTPRQKMEQKLHDSHIGSQGCLCRAQETVYWPGMNAKITDYIQKCDVCMSLQKNQTKVPLICHEPTSRSWEKVATDIIHTWWQELSVHSNYYSGYFEVDQLHGKTGTVIIKKLKKHFVTHGTPNELLSGNEPPFNSAEFENFLRSSGTAYVTGSLATPKRNGRVENVVKTAKSLIKKVKATGANYFLILLSWRNTPMEGLSTSPVVLRWQSLSLSLLNVWDCYRYTNHKIVQSLWELWCCWELNDSTSVLGEESVSRKNT